MSLTEMLPVVYSLQREEKLRLYQLLGRHLAEEESDPPLPLELHCEFWSTCTDRTGAQKLHEFLQDARKES